MSGLRGYSGWRWIFIIGNYKSISCFIDVTDARAEGLVTCVVSFAIYFMIPDFPEETKW